MRGADSETATSTSGASAKAPTRARCALLPTMNNQVVGAPHLGDAVDREADRLVDRHEQVISRKDPAQVDDR
jgi:hypothetical protein